MIKRLIILLLFAPITLFAQFTDDFEDGDISNWTESTVGRWAASTISPLYGTYSLHHVFDNSAGDHDQVSVSLPIFDFGADTVKWKFRIKHAYDPSSSNNWAIYLISDEGSSEMYPSGSASGYVVGVNYTGSTDTLKFWKVSSGSATEVFKTSVNWQVDVGTTKSPAIEVFRTPNGNWEIEFNGDGDFNNLDSIGSGFDDTFLFSDYFGVYYEYSSTQDQKLWIDDIYIDGQIYVDNDPPQVISASVISPVILSLGFNEKVDSTIAVNVSNYIVDNGIGAPDSIHLCDTKNGVDLFFTESFVNGNYYHITIQNIEDQNGNIMADTTVNFSYFVPEAYNAVINEFMADPTPAIGLPEYEYIEIKNTTAFDIDLTGWKLKIGTTVKSFPASILDSASYLILCSTAASSELSTYGNVLEFTSMSITNDGISIALFDENNSQIDSINFTKDWYNDLDKVEGGWSLERVDPLNTCSTTSNWKVSEDIKGGTPGTENSVYASNIDNLAPELENLEIISNNQIKLTFNEFVTTSTLTEKTNYTIDHGIGNPISVSAGSDSREVDLVFSNSFPEKIKLTLSIKNLSDECGNAISSANTNFVYYPAQAYDVVINEIMADPEPSIELPEFEYIEIYNTSEFDIDLTNWTISVGSTTRTLPAETVKAGEYIILCSTDAESELQGYGKTLAVSGFPTLTNSGQTIVLRDKQNQIISTVTYSDKWYKDDYKSEGGWSLEQIDPMNSCGGENNWIASESNLGGTPGQINSVNASNPDNDAPELLRAVLVDSVTVKLFFNESIDSISAIQLGIYTVDQGAGNPISVHLIGPDYKSVVLGFLNEFTANKIYTLEITGGIIDCSGNEISAYSSAKFAIPANPELNDLVVNEVLFNTLVGGFDFVEIYNRSEKTIDLKDVFISGYDYDNSVYKGVVQISSDGFLIFPGDYVVVTEDPEIVQQQYYSSNPKGFVENANLPSFNDDQGRVILMDKIQTIIDDFEYNENMQFPLLATAEGVSLERINFERPTNDKTNWHSASELVGFATPAYQNSQFIESGDIQDDVTIEPEVFSPDNDGYEDVANINFSFNEPGYVANIKIFDAKGRLIIYLANNQLLGVDGVITWDGLDGNHQKAPVGIYVVFIEIFDLDGNVKQYKKSVVVAAKW